MLNSVDNGVGAGPMKEVGKDAVNFRLLCICLWSVDVLQAAVTIYRDMVKAISRESSYVLLNILQALR